MRALFQGKNCALHRIVLCTNVVYCTLHNIWVEIAELTSLHFNIWLAAKPLLKQATPAEYFCIPSLHFTQMSRARCALLSAKLLLTQKQVVMFELNLSSLLIFRTIIGSKLPKSSCDITFYKLWWRPIIHHVTIIANQAQHSMASLDLTAIKLHNTFTKLCSRP